MKSAMRGFSKLTVCLDMAGCPNRCRHCWLGHTPNGRMTDEDLRFVAAAFRPFADVLEMAGWYREPDYTDDYRGRWALEQALSDEHAPHFELVSFWRAVRDTSYVPWLWEQGVRVCQLTLFGGREMTDCYVGRRGAYDEVVETVEILLKQGMVPRIQVFVDRENIREMDGVMALVREREWETRCAVAGVPFALFVHQGSCDGENAKRYAVRVTPEEVAMLPEEMVAHTLRYTGKACLENVFGRTEAAWYAALVDSDEVAVLTELRPVLLVDGDFDVYPNSTCPAPYWRLGNLKTDGAAAVLARYREGGTLAQQIRRTVPLGEIIRAVGQAESLRLFTRGDYIHWVLNRFCEREMQND